MPTEPITIELLDRIDRVCEKEPLLLNLVIRCPVDGSPVELRSIVSRDLSIAELDTDLFERDLILRPGEVYRCVVVARFRTTGLYPEPLFQIQVGRADTTFRPRIPTPPIRVVPSLANELRVQAEAICTYEHGTKIDVTVKHTGATKFDDFRLVVGPTNAVRAGLSDQRRPVFMPNEEFKFTTVIAANDLDLVLDAFVGGERVGPVPLKIVVPAIRTDETAAPFRFLEPRQLTQADVRIRTQDDASELIPPQAGVYDVSGGGTKYRVEIKPAHPQASGVRLRGLSGSVEVTELPGEQGTWVFQMVVLSNGMFTTPVALHYDVTTPDGPQQGELNLSVRPHSTKLWVVAATAGFALTAKGIASIVPAILSPGDLWESLRSAMSKVDTLWDVAQLLSIPALRGGLWLVDQIMQPFRDG